MKNYNDQDPLRVGIIGTGYVSRYFYSTFHARQGINVTRALTRRALTDCADYPNQDILTHSLHELLDHCDVVYECSGDAIHATGVVAEAIAANVPVVTTNAEFHVTTGSYFAGQKMVTEAEGDQPGALAALHERAVEMGFKPLAYINNKGFLNTNPTLKDMQYWSKRQGISLACVTSFTDGTKIQIEQALVANGLGATFAEPGMMGITHSEIDKAVLHFGDTAKKLKKPISDYMLYAGAPHSVFVVAEHEDLQQPMLQYVKMGQGPYYTLHQGAILIHLEIPRTLHRFMHDRDVLLDNSTTPSINVAAVAKNTLRAGSTITKAIGSFDVRGMGMKIVDCPDAVPIGLLANAHVIRNIEPQQVITFNDVELPETLALNAWQSIKQHVMLAHASVCEAH